MVTHEDCRSLADLRRVRDGLPEGSGRSAVSKVIGWLEEQEEQLRDDEGGRALLRSNEFVFYKDSDQYRSEGFVGDDGPFAWIADRCMMWNRIRWQMVVDAGRVQDAIDEWTRMRAHDWQSDSYRTHITWVIEQFSSPTPVWA